MLKAIRLERENLGTRGNVIGKEFVLSSIAILVVLLVARSYHHLLFHTIAELFAVFVAVTTWIVAWQMFPFTRNHYLMYLGNGYLRGSGTFDAVPDSAVVVDKGCVIRQVNKEAVNLTGLSQNELIGRNCHDLFHPQALNRKECPVCNGIRQGKNLSVMELELPEKEKWFDFSLSSISTETEALGAVQVIRDITERKLAEIEIKRSRDKLEDRTLELSMALNELENEMGMRESAQREITALATFPGESPQPIMRLEKDGTIIFSNKASDQLLKDWGCAVGKEDS